MRCPRSAAARVAHHGHDHADPLPRAAHVHPQHGVPVVGRELGQRALGREPLVDRGIVDQDVDAAELGAGPLDHPDPVVVGGDVAGLEHGAARIRVRLLGECGARLGRAPPSVTTMFAPPAAKACTWWPPMPTAASVTIFAAAPLVSGAISCRNAACSGGSWSIGGKRWSDTAGTYTPPVEE